MAQQANMRYVRNLLYKLKRQYGAKVTIYKTLTSEVDPKTGERTTTRQVVQIRHAVVLPDTLARKFAYEHSFLAANRAFTYGAQWDVGQRLCIIDGEDLPRDFLIEIETSVVFENQRYTVKTADRLDIGFGYLLTLVRTEGNFPLQIHDLTICHEMAFGHSSAGEL